MVRPNVVTHFIGYGAIYDVSYRFTTIVLGLCIRDNSIHVKKGHRQKSVGATQYELWFSSKPKLSFLKDWGCNAYVKKFQPDKLKPKSEKCVFIGYPKRKCWVHLLSQIRRKDIRCWEWILSREGVSLERSEWEESRTWWGNCTCSLIGK